MSSPFGTNNPGIGGLDELTSVEEAIVASIASLGSAGESLVVNAGADGVEWSTPAGGGDVSAASNFGTDNSVIRANGTTKGVQSSGITIDDSDNVDGVGSMTVSEMTAPGTPASGKVVIYSKTDGKLYIKDDTGTETDLTSGGGGTVDVVSNVAPDRILGRTTAGSGDSEELTAAQTRALILDGASLTDIGTPASGDKVLIQDISDSSILKYVDFSDFSGTGDVVGPASATDDAIVVYDGTTGKLVKNSDVFISLGALSATDDLPLGNQYGTVAIFSTIGIAPVNYFAVRASDSGSALQLTASGSDTNISMNLVPKGSGEAQIAGERILDETDIGTNVQGYDANLPTWPATVDATEVGYLDGVTSAIQTQLNAKEGTLSSATTSAEGKVELTTTAEVDTGTDTSRAVTADALAGSYAGSKCVSIMLTEPATDCTTGDGKAYFMVPAELGGMNLVDVKAGVATAGTTGTHDLQIHNVTDAVDMLSTKLTIDSTETTSETAATAAVINTANDDVAEGDILRIDCDAIQTTAAKGDFITLVFRLP